MMMKWKFAVYSINNIGNTVKCVFLTFKKGVGRRLNLAVFISLESKNKLDLASFWMVFPIKCTFLSKI